MLIEKNIKINGITGPGRPMLYPWREMEVGDSIFFEGQNTQGRASVASKRWAKNNGVLFMSRSVEGGVRIWRIA